jgi:hypothetical protein
MRVKTKREMRYGTKHYAAGDEIEMSARDAKLLTLLDRVGPAGEVRVRSGPVPEDDAKAKGRKGTYKRRDMRAEDQTTKEDTGEE